MWRGQTRKVTKGQKKREEDKWDKPEYTNNKAPGQRTKRERDTEKNEKWINGKKTIGIKDDK